MANYEKLLKIESRSVFPKILNIETTSICNLKCPMCPRTHFMTRDAVHMEESLFRKIVDEASKHELSAVWLHVFGEPMLHPQIGQLICYIKRHKNIQNVGLSTNCDILTPERSRAVLEAGLDRIILSVDAVDEATYGEVRGGAFTKVLKNVRGFLELREKISAPTKVQVSCIDMDLNREDVERFRSEWESLLRDGEEVLIKGFTNFGGQIDKIGPRCEVRDYELVPCRKLWNSMTILSKGEVVACCYDVNGKMKLGSLKESSLEKLWRGDVLQSLRRIHREGRFNELPLCTNCSAIRQPLKIEE